MINSYVSKIRAKVSIYSKNKTSNLFDGSYKSVYQGNGMDFENLREYVPGDNIKDIDWKATSRGNKVLVKEYIAEKKHNIMLVFDTGKKMTAVTRDREKKKDIALNAGGTVGYLAAINGNNVGAIFNVNGMIQYFQLKTGLINVERILTEYDRSDLEGYDASLEKSLNYITRYIKRRMIVFVITDAAGISSISDDTLKKLVWQHDVLFISVTDGNISDGNAYSVDRGMYVPEYVAQNEKLKKIETDTKEKLRLDNEAKMKRHSIVSAEISCQEELVDRVTELLGGHKYANSRR